MNELERAKKKLDLIEHAIFNISFAAKEEQKLTHSKHIDPLYQEALDRLDVKLTGARAYLSRIETVGR